MRWSSLNGARLLLEDNYHRDSVYDSLMGYVKNVLRLPEARVGYSRRELFSLRLPGSSAQLWRVAAHNCLRLPRSSVMERLRQAGKSASLDGSATPRSLLCHRDISANTPQPRYSRVYLA